MEYEKTECPKWCEDEPEHDQGHIMRFHWGSRTAVYPNGMGVPDRVRVGAYMETFAGKDRPAAVSFGAASGDQEHMSFAHLTAGDARVLASVIEILSGATPEQHEEYAAGARSAAHAIENEPEAE